MRRNHSELKTRMWSKVQQVATLIALRSTGSAAAERSGSTKCNARAETANIDRRYIHVMLENFPNHRPLCACSELWRLVQWLTATRLDLIYFRKGGDAQVPVKTAGNRLLVSMPDGQVELSRVNVRKLIPGFWVSEADCGPAAPWPGDGSRFRCSVRGCLVGARKRPDEGGGSGNSRASSARPEACAVRANGSHARKARSSVPRPGFNRVSEGAWNRGQRGARAARDPLPPAFRG